MDKLVLTGASGFLGAPLSRCLGQDYDVIEVRRLVPQASSANQIVEWDLLKDRHYDDLFARTNATTLVHGAWSMSANDYNLPTNFDWVEASLGIVRSFVENGGTTVVGIGSCVQYDWGDGVCVEGVCVEDSTPRSHANTYAVCKNIVEDYVTAFCGHHGIRCLWLRPFFMYGPAEDPSRLVADIATSVLRGDVATIRNGGLDRDYLHVEDVAGLIRALIRSDAHGICNAGAGEVVSLGEIGRTIARLSGREDLLRVEVPEIVKGKTVVADMSRSREFIDYTPRYTLQSGLEHTLNWWKQHA